MSAPMPGAAAGAHTVDAVLVQRLCGASAVLVAMLNMDESASGFTTETSQAEVRKITLHQVHLARQGGAG